MSKIVFGTGKLGRLNSSKYERLLINTMGSALERGLDIHLSPSYGNSFQVIRKNFYPLSQYKSNFIVKVDGSCLEYLEYQIVLTKRMLGIKGPVEIQLTGDLHLRDNGFYEIDNKIDELTGKGLINFCYFTPIYSDSENFLEVIGKNNIGFCLHFSLVEREFKETFFDQLQKHKNIRVIALRAFGESLIGYGNWHYPVFLEKKPSQIIEQQHNTHSQICHDSGISNAESRLKYALHHPSITRGIFTFSTEMQLDQALEAEKTIPDTAVLNSLSEFALKFANMNRPEVGSSQPANLNFIYLHNFIISFVTACQLGLVRFFLRNLGKRLITHLVTKAVHYRKIIREMKDV
tara:strand:+ start:867 stop:1910 length:1044 start_codon:yes stop_codon:yes gene_type:complete